MLGGGAGLLRMRKGAEFPEKQKNGNLHYTGNECKGMLHAASLNTTQCIDPHTQDKYYDMS